MPAYTYNFTGADTAYSASSFPTPAGMPVLAPVSGSWARKSNRAAAQAGPAILAADFTNANLDVSADVSSGGGDAVYVRIGGANDWIRAIIRRWQVPTSYQTLYEVRQDYFGTGNNLTAWGTSTDPSTYTFPDTYDQVTSDGVLHHWAKYGNPYLTGNTTQSPVSYNYFRRVYLQAAVAGTITALGDVAAGSLTHIRVSAAANTISVFLDNATTPAITATSTAGAANTRHGVGFELLTGDGGTMSGSALDNLAVATNNPPNAPNLSAPVTGSNLNTAITNRLSWAFSDPNPGDSQTAAELRYRAVGDLTWTSVSISGPNNFWDGAAATFTAGTDYEWQVRTTDTSAAQGPWSTSSFFTGVVAPGGPTITSPVNGADVPQTLTLAWTATAQDSYQWRRTADAADGSADTGTIYFDSGEVADAAGRQVPVAFEVNDRWEHLQVRVKASGLWGPWSDARVHVTYTPPAVPVVLLTPDTAHGALVVSITNPAPSGGEPGVSYNDVWIDDGLGAGSQRLATNLPANAVYVYPTPVQTRDYDGAVRVVTYADNGTTAANS